MGDYELYHAATRKHKYIKKIGKRYFYTQQEIAAYLNEKKNTIDSADVDLVRRSNAMVNGRPDKITGVEIKANPYKKYTDKNKLYYTTEYKTKKGVSVQGGKITAYNSKNGSTNTHTLDLNKPKKAIDKKKKQARDLKEAVAEATGRRDVYYEAKKVTENGRTYYDDDNAKLRTGKKDKKGRVDPEDGSVYTKKGTMQYDNEYTIERNKKTRARGKKKLKKMATQPVRNLKKQSSRGKKAISKFYRNNVNPGVTVTYDEAKLK